MNQPQTVIVGMSGGVDSSVAAKLLIDEGYAVQGLFMKNWEEDDGTDYCTALEDLADAQSVCDKLGIALHTANFSAEYWDNVFEHFLEEYRAGRTPNPDILCNREIKFNVFREYAEILGADKIATGHYVRMGDSSKPQLLKGLDQGKDQSYFLQSVSEQQLENCLFPVGHLEKPEVRRIAEEHGLSTHAKKDSTGICFIGERRFQDFLKQYIPAQPGDIVDIEGRYLGKHTGVMFYTFGQRQGLGIGGVKNQSEQPWYVVGKDVERNILTVAQGNDNQALFSKRLFCKEIAWIDGQGPQLPCSLAAKTRYRQPDQACRVTTINSDSGVASRHRYQVDFNQPQRAVTPGQWICFYDGEICLGGGIIEETQLVGSFESKSPTASYAPEGLEL